MHALLNKEHLVNAPISEGDSGIIIRKNGDFNVFTTGNIDVDNLTEQQLKVAHTLTALSLALIHPRIMNVLLEMAADPAIVGTGIDLGSVN